MIGYSNSIRKRGFGCLKLKGKYNVQSEKLGKVTRKRHVQIFKNKKKGTKRIKIKCCKAALWDSSLATLV